MLENKRPKSSLGSPAATSSRLTVSCPVCKQNVGSQRFAYHLQKCMGGGSRKSSKERRRKLSATTTSGAQEPSTTQDGTNKVSRLDTDKEYFSKNPIIVKIRLRDNGKHHLRCKWVDISVLPCIIT